MQGGIQGDKKHIDDILDYIHVDVWEPIDVTSNGGVRYFLTFVDDFFMKVWVHFLAHKFEVFSQFKTWCVKVEN